MQRLNSLSGTLRKQFPLPPWGNELDSAKWSFLNGYRGFLAIWVVIAHVAREYTMFERHPFFQFPLQSVGFISVSGFFVLSAFLLTYRLLKDLSNPSTSLADCYLVGYLFFCLVENQLIKVANYLCKKCDKFFASRKTISIESC
jgi:hypothetical protein